MKTILSPLALAALLTIAAVTPATAQAPQAGHPTYVDSDIRLVVDYPAIAAKAFTAAPVQPLHKGNVLPAKGVIGPLGLTQMWSLRTHAFALASQTLTYPVIGSVRCSNFSATGSFTRVIASTTSIKADLKAGQVLHSGGYLVQAAEPIKAGETIPSLLVTFFGKFFILSLAEAPQSQKKDLAPQPRLSIADDRATPADRDIALEAWRVANQSARAGLYTSPQ
jgi:hypothetical protein